MSRDYYLPACIVLFAAAIGNRKACQFAFDALPLARRWASENQPETYELARTQQGGNRRYPGQFVSNRQEADSEP
jgi:hypothetical protein